VGNYEANGYYDKEKSHKLLPKFFFLVLQKK
jgi:hypothetical protein